MFTPHDLNNKEVDWKKLTVNGFHLDFKVDEDAAGELYILIRKMMHVSTVSTVKLEWRTLDIQC